MKTKLVAIALLVFAPLSVAQVQHARTVSEITVVQPDTVAVADDFLHNKATDYFITLKFLSKNAAYWSDGRGTYFFYAGWYSLKFECQHIRVSSKGRKVISHKQRIIDTWLSGGVHYAAVLQPPDPEPCNVNLQVKKQP